MIRRYIIRPVDVSQRSRAWAPTLAKAIQMKDRLQRLTNLKWRIIPQDGYINSIGQRAAD